MTVTMYPTIVVGVDGSPDSEAALRWALDYAGATHGDVTAVTAREYHIASVVEPIQTEDDFATEARHRLDRSLERVVKDSDDVRPSTSVVMDRPARALTEAAAGADLLVVGSHGLGELPGVHLGSTAHYCVHHSPCPTVVVRPRPELDEPPHDVVDHRLVDIERAEIH
jgi:nucleotide-binding universal stress UspA family protein